MGASESKPIMDATIPIPPNNIFPKTDVIDGKAVGSAYSDNLKGHEQLKDGLESFIVDAGTFIQGGSDMSLEAATLVAMNGGASDADEKMTKLHKEISERVENLGELRSILKETFEKLHHLAKKGGDNEEEIEHLLKIEEKVLRENDNQIDALHHILNIVVKPTTEEIKSFLKKNNKFSALVKLLGKDNYGKKDASHRLSLTYTNLHDYSKLANKVNKALETVGLSASKYEKLHNLSELKEELSQIVRKLVKENKDAKIVNVFKAIHLLEHSIHKHNEIVKFLGKKSEKTLEHHMDKVSGGADYHAKSERKLGVEIRDNLVQKLKENQKVLSEIINYFVEDMNKQFDSMYKSIDSLAPSIGKTIKYDQPLIDLVESFQDLNEFSDNFNLYSSLLEINDKVEAKEIKQRFIKYLDNIKHRISVLENNEYLKHISTTIDQIKEIIDTFSDSVKDIKKRVRKEGGKEEVGEYEYIPEDFKINEHMIQQLNSNITKVVNKFGFYANVASIRQNMIRMSQEQKLYSENYEERLGKSIADQISHINDTFTANIDAIDDESTGTGLALKLYNNSKTKESDKFDKSDIKTIYQWQYDARVELYKTIEAIDLYLMHFTDAIASNPDAVLELNKMLSGTKVITKWYNDKSGNNLIDVFESFNPDETKTPETTGDYTSYSPIDLDSTTLLAENLKSTFEACKKAIDSIVIVKNILSFVIHIGEKFGNLDLNSKLNMHPNMINKNLVKYVWASSFSVNITNGQVSMKMIKSNPYSSDLSNVGLKSSDSQKDKDLQAIHKVGNQLLKDLPLMTTIDGDINFKNKIEIFNKLYKELFVFGSLPTTGTLDDSFKLNLRNALNMIDMELNKTSSINTIFVEEDQYFVLTIKALVAKVLTVVGTHSLLKKPDIARNQIINPVRRILGGASDPEVIPEAVELYIRLPLLVEFYRNIFDKGNKDFKQSSGKVSDADTEMVAYVPEVGSIWSGLIQTIFDKSKYIDNSVYSSENIKNIIIEINSIYKHFMKNSNKKEITRTTILELVAEINRRYGIIKRKDLAEYYKYTEDEEELYTIKEAKSSKIGENLDYDIFGDDKNIRSKNNPSEEYIEYNKTKSGSKYKKYMKTSDYKIIEDFRKKINSEFNETELKSVDGSSLNTQIKYYTNQIGKLSDNRKKYDLVVRAIEDVNNVNSTNTDAELMFHEVVVTPLAILNQLHIYTKSFINRYHEYIKYLAQPNPTSTNKTLEKQKDMILTSYGSFKLTPVPNDITQIFRLLNSFTNDMTELVVLKFVSKNKILLDTSKLQEYVESSLNNIKYMVSKFTNIIDKNIIKKYEDIKVVGSIYNLEEQFINILLNNKNKKNSEEYAMRTFQSMELSLPYIIDMANDTQIKTNIDFLYPRMIWDNKTAFKKVDDVKQLMNDVFRTYDLKTRKWTQIDHITFDNRVVDGDSILSKFNQLTHDYLNQFYDTASKKIYSNLFKSFTSDIISNLPNECGFIDMYESDEPTTWPTQNEYLPKDSNIISASLAHTIKVLNNRSLNRQLPEKYHLNMAINDVAPHMIEKMKGQLPTFIKLYELYIKKCILYGKLLENDTIYNLNNEFTNVIINNPLLTIVDDNNDTIQFAKNFMDGNMNSSTRLGYYRNLLANAIESARCIINDATMVLDEIHALDNSSVIYFDIKKNFTKNFYDNTKEYPFMPLSLMTTIFNQDNIYDVYPNISNTSSENKFIYGSRSVLVSNKEIKLDNMVYVKHLFTKFNNYSNKINNIELDKINSYININTQLLRFLSEKTIYNRSIDHFMDMYTLKTNVGYFRLDRMYTFEIGKSTNDLISLVENTSVENSEHKISEFINDLGAGSSYDRTKASLINIIDMNLVPINIHALMREVPLINIYNYAFTFDEIVRRDLASSDTIVTEFKQLLLDPYTPIRVSTDPFSLTISPNMRSLNEEMPSLGLNKPRFLSDGIYDKFISGFKGDSKLRDQRMSSKLIRNVVFLANVQRFLRYSIRNELQIISDRVVDNLQTISSQITDYDELHKSYDDKEFEFKF